MAVGDAVQRSVRTLRTSTLTVGYETVGDPADPPVVLLHGFPDDVRAWDGVAPGLAAAGLYVVAPYLRGYGPTRLLDPAEPRRAQQTALAQDLLDLMDGLAIERALLAGYDWGGRAACVATLLAPARVRGLVTVGGYNVQNTLAPPPVRSAVEARAYWYQWYFNTEQGRRGLAADRRGICRLLWEEWSPSWRFDDATFERTAASFDNPDFVDVVVHSYRHRHGNAPGDARFDDAERKMAARPAIEVPTVVLHGGDDAVLPPHRSQDDTDRFPPGTERRVVPGAGHFLPRERPHVVTEALIELADRSR